jgi:hypothetical protein
LSPRKREELETLLTELKKRSEPCFVDGKFPMQKKFIRDPALRKVVLCTRRSGKSFGGGSYLLKVAYQNPGCSVLYIALTRESAKNIMWKDVLKVLNRNLDLNAKFHENDLTCTLPNGSVVRLLGVDSTEEEKQKILGQKYALVIIDEAAQFSIDLNELIVGVLTPAVSDYRGTICLIGTPSNLRKGLYFELTNGQDPGVSGTWETRGWKGFRWSAFDNPYMKVQWQETIDALKASNPAIEDTPLFQQHYYGRWVINDVNLVYSYVPGRNDFTKLPDLDNKRGRWHNVLGVDLGYDDPSAFSLCTYHDFDQTLYVLESEKQKGMDITAVANKIRAYKVRCEIDTVIVDNANKQAVEEMRKRHDLALRAADKTGKADFIELMNAEFTMGRIKLCLSKCQELSEEYGGLIWDDRAARREEHPACDNHCTDATLYAWRHCHQYLSQSPSVAPKPGTFDWFAREAREMEERELEKLEEEKFREKEYQRSPYN